MKYQFFPLARVAVGGMAACVAIAGFMGCSSGSQTDHAGQPARPTVDAATHDAAGHAVAVQQPSPVELRAQLEQLLGQHAILTVRLTRARLRGDEDLAQTADEALSKNAADLAAPIGAVYGAEAAETFEQAWFNHVTYVFNYARGVADDDAAVKAEARRQLNGYTTDLSDYLAEATHQAMPAIAGSRNATRKSLVMMASVRTCGPIVWPAPATCATSWMAPPRNTPISCSE